MNTPNPIAAMKAQIRSLRREMKLSGIRVVSCFNGGLTQMESYYNQQLFRLKTELARLK